MNSVTTESDAFRVWALHREHTSGLSLILSIPGTSPFRRKLQGVFGQNAHLISGFSHEGFFFLNDRIFGELHAGKESKIECQYLIAFDSNAASHLRALFNGSTSQSIRDLDELLKCFDYNRLNWQILPYLLENLAFNEHPSNLREIRETILAVEKLADLDKERYKKTGQFCQKTTNDDLVKKSDIYLSKIRELIQRGEFKMMTQFWELMYACVLKAAILHIRNPKQEHAAQNFKAFVAFMHEDLHCMLMTVLKIACLWFSGDEQASLLTPLQRGGKNLINKAKNIAWDINHLVRLPQESVIPSKVGAFLVPHLLTFDFKLSKIMNACGLRLCLVDEETCYPYCVQDDSIEPAIRLFCAFDPSIEEYFTLDAYHERGKYMESADRTYISKLCKILEGELTELESEFN